MDKIIKNCSQISHPIDLIVLPETAYDDLGQMDEIFDNQYLKDLEQLDQCDGFLIGGVLSSRPFLFEQHKPNGYSYMSNRPIFYHNSSIVVAGGMRQIKHKQALVPFNEYIPDLFYRILPKVKPSFKHFRKDNNEVFSPFTIGNIMLGTAICYESLFGYKVSRSVASGANLIAFQYNEGWYNSKNGARKMLAHACLRANEVHKYVVNSSNCGYSAIIDVNGRIVKRTSDSVDLKGVVHLNMKSTPYVIVGDLVGTLSIVALLYLGVFNYSYFRSA